MRKNLWVVLTVSLMMSTNGFAATASISSDQHTQNGSVNYIANNTTAEQCDPMSVLVLGTTPVYKIPLDYTAKTNPAAVSIAQAIIDQMVSHLSETTKNALRMIPTIIYHCDPELITGQGLNPYQRDKFDYITLLPPKDNCADFQNHPAGGGRSWDAMYGVAPWDHAVNCNGTQCSCTTGFTDLCQITTICDENLICGEKNAYPAESILVHEFAHTILGNGLVNGDATERGYASQITNQIYPDYLQRICKFDTGIYSCSSAQEMWAEASQAWFSATKRTDVNIGIETSAAIKTNMPQLYDILEKVYGPEQDVHPVLSCS